MPELWTYREAVRDALAGDARRRGRLRDGRGHRRDGRLDGRHPGNARRVRPRAVRNTPISRWRSSAPASARRCRDAPRRRGHVRDFLTLAAEQLVNQAAKHRYMSGGQVKVPLTVPHPGRCRLVAGARSTPSSSRPGSCTFPASRSSSPRPRPTRGSSGPRSTTTIPSSSSSTARSTGLQGGAARRDRADPDRQGAGPPRGRGRDGRRDAGLVHEALAAAEDAEKEGVSVEVVDPRTLQPLDEQALVDSVKKTNRQSSRTRPSRRWATAPRWPRSSSTRPSTGSTLRSSVSARSSPILLCARDGGVRRPPPSRRLRGDHAHRGTQWQLRSAFRGWVRAWRPGRSSAG